MRRKLSQKLLTMVILSAVLASGFLVSEGMAAASSPGSTADPLVSKSYVDDKINQVLGILNSVQTGSGISQTNPGSTISGSADYDEVVSDVMAQIEFLYGNQLANAGSYVPVSATAGQVLLGGEGTEIILRSGKAVGRCPGTNGIVDATDGTEIMNDIPVQINHMLIVPRDDGRGVSVTSDAWFIVKGDYMLQ